MSRLIVHLLSTIDRNISRSDTCVCWIATHLSVIHPSNESGPSVNKPASQQVNTTAATSPSLIINYISFNCRMCAAMQCGVESVNHHTYGMFLPGYYHHHLLFLLRLYLIFLSPSIRDFWIEKVILSSQSPVTTNYFFSSPVRGRRRTATADCVRFQYANIVLDAPTSTWDNRQQSLTFNLCYTSTLCLTNYLVFLLLITDRWTARCYIHVIREHIMYKIFWRETRRSVVFYIFFQFFSSWFHVTTTITWTWISEWGWWLATRGSWM